MNIQCPICKSQIIKYYMKQNLINIYECKICKTAIIPTNKITKLDIYDFKSYNKLRSKYSKRFQKITNEIKKIKKTGDVLDVGCGFGLLSSILIKNGYCVESIEPYQKTQYIRNSLVHKIKLEEFFKKNNKQYDIVVLADVLEHFKKPKEIIEKIKRILKNEGLVVIQTPNYQSLMAKLCINWSWWMLEDHKVIFSNNSLNKVLKDAGLSILRNKSYEELSDFKQNLDGNFSEIQNPYIRKAIKITFYVPFFIFYIVFRNLIWYMGYGGLILNISKKQ